MARLLQALVCLGIIGCAVVYGSEWVGDLLDGENTVEKSGLARQREDERLQIRLVQRQDTGAAIADHEMRLERAARVLSRIVSCVNTHVARHQEREAVADCNYSDDEAVAFHQDENSGRISSEESNALMQQAEGSARTNPE